MLLSATRAATSIRFGPHETAPGPETSAGPPRLSQPLQPDPFQNLCTRPFSGPLANTSRRLGPHEEISGADVMLPPMFSGPLHTPTELSNHQCMTLLSLALATMSRRPGPHDTAAGPGASVALPILSHGYQPLLHALCQSPLSVPLAKMSNRFAPHEAMSGSEVRVPPRFSGPFQIPLAFSNHQCWMLLL